MQGVVKAYDPVTRQGVLVRDDAARTEYDLADDALVGSVFRMLRQGQRVVFDVDERGLATTLRLGSELDMGTFDFSE
jgi:CspA family cold shock protein